MTPLRHAAAYALLAAAPLGAGELLQPLDEADFQVNSYTTGFQLYPAAAADGEGSFLVAWQSAGSAGGDTSSNSIQGQVYSMDGAAQGGQLQINSYTTGSQNIPAVAALPSGFLVVWHSFGSPGTDTDGASVQGRYVSTAAAEGASLPGAQFQVNAITTSFQLRPDVDTDAAGNAVVVWDEVGTSIQGRTVDSGGALGAQFQVNTATTGVHVDAAVAVAPSGHFVVVWEAGFSFGDDNDGRSIQGQRFLADGTPLGGQFQVNEATTGDQSAPQVVFHDDAAFTVAWQDEIPPALAPEGGPTLPEHDFEQRTFEFEAFKFLFGEAVAGAIASGSLDSAHLTVADVYFLLTLLEAPVTASVPGAEGPTPADDSESYLTVKLISVAGAVADEIPQLNTTTPGRQSLPALAVAPDAHVLAVWQHTPPVAAAAAESTGAAEGAPPPDTSGSSIRARRLTLPVLLDDFESGETDRWSFATG